MGGNRISISAYFLPVLAYSREEVIIVSWRTRDAKTFRTEYNRIVKYMKAAGTYEPFFKDTIEHLADLYLDLIRADQELEADGSGITVVQTNKAGAEYRCLNPILEAKYTILRECRNYEAKLGLTPADHRKIMSERNEQPESTLGAALRMLSS